MKTAKVAHTLLLCIVFISNINNNQGQGNYDIVIKYEAKNTSFLELARQLNVTFGTRFLKGCNLQSSRSCEGRCGKWERNERLKCYCDDICQELGDCCYDYYTRCAKTVGKQKASMHSCLDSIQRDTRGWGFVVVSNCPAYVSKSSQLVRACVQPNPSDTFQLLPVLDKETNISYKNYFCARCNRATNVTFWQAQRSCDNIFIRNVEAFNLTTFMQQHCVKKQKTSWTFSPPRGATTQYCAVRQHRRWCKKADSNNKVSWEMVKGLCKAYYLPVCKQWSPPSFGGTPYNNPHCLLCGLRSGTPLIDLHCLDCPVQTDAVVLPQGIQVLFDFSSTSKFKIDVGFRKTVVVETDRCSKHQVYDPFSQSCRDLAPVPEPLIKRKTHLNNPTSNTILSNSTSNVTLTKKCVRIPFTNEEVTFFSNGSVFIKPHNRVYPKTLYISSKNGIILCTNFSQNYTKTIGGFKENKENVHSLPFSIITCVGGALSVISLIILIALYVRIKEIKKLPGKIVMSLSCALLVFQVGFFLTGLTGRPALCSAMAVVLHYFLLASFTWMNVLAADMAFTFVSMEAGVAVLPAHDGEHRKFLKYCCHGWVAPMVWVGVCVSLELSQAVTIGYGSLKSCWISNGKALLYVVCVPVAVLLAFNLAALVLSVVAIRSTRQNTRQVSKDSKALDLPLLCLKLTVIFGLTWALGFAAAFEETAFIWYPFVILNSLQGVLLFMALKAHTKVYRLFKGPGSDMSSRGSQAHTKSAVMSTTAM